MARVHRGWAVVGAALFLAAVSAPARAQQPASGDPRALFQQGVQLLDEHRYAEAIDALRRSIALREAPPAVYNLGLAQRGAGYHHDAIASFRRFLAIATDPRFASTRQTVSDSIAELERSMPVVVLHVAGSPEHVRIDGEDVEASDGTRELRLDPRPHRFEALRTGYAPVSRELEPGPGTRNEVELDVGVHALPVHLSIEVTPRDAEIRVNGSVVGRGTYALEDAPGRYVVEASSDDYEPERRVVTLRAGASERMTLSLAESNPPVTSRWWFWTSIAAVVAIGVGVGIYAYVTPGPTDNGSLGVFVEVLRAP